MLKRFTLEYWEDDGWYVGRRKDVPGVFSQGETLQEVEDNIRNAYQLMREDDTVVSCSGIYKKEIEVSHA